MIGQYMAIGIHNTVRGIQERADIKRNIENISKLIEGAVTFVSLDLPVRLIALPEGGITGFTDEVFDYEHTKAARELYIDIPGEETEMLGEIAKRHNCYLIVQCKAKEKDISMFPERFTNNAFIIDPKGEIILRHRKYQTYPLLESSVSPHDIYDEWVEKFGDSLDAFFPVADTEIGRIGPIICMEGSFPESFRALALNGAEIIYIIYRSSYPEPWIGYGWFELQNRSGALSNNCYVISPNFGHYYVTPDSEDSFDIGGNSLIIDYRGNVISRYDSAGTSFVAGIIDIDALREYRSRAHFGNFLPQLRTEVWAKMYEKSIYPKNLWLNSHPPKQSGMRNIIQKCIEKLQEENVYKKS